MTRIQDIPEEERTPLVLQLIAIIHNQQEQIQALRDEVAILKGQKPKPKIMPPAMDKELKRKKRNKKKRAGSLKRKKTKKLKIHETKIVSAFEVPKNSEFKGYQEYTVQGLVIKPHNIVYKLERWKTPQGEYIHGKLPQEAGNGHFDNTLISFILYQHYHALVTQPLIWEQLHEWGIEISTGQLNNIITEGKEQFHIEKDEILRTGLKVSQYIHVDDTGARHNGKNGYCTHIGNELFAWFKSTGNKSRINFLELLQAGNTGYKLNEEALDYMKRQKLPLIPTALLSAEKGRFFTSKEELSSYLKKQEITNNYHVRIITEGALIGNMFEHGFNPELVIMSDDAGQFNILLHTLCWIHAERSIRKLVGFNDEQRAAIKLTRTRIWDFYKVLKAYKESPASNKKNEINMRFEDIFNQYTTCTMLNKALKQIYKNKKELLLVLEYPDIPLHNNLSENDIREYVKKRKISGSTRSTNGRRCRDTFVSLKKTCRKNGVSFWEYLKDRISKINNIPNLSHIVQLRAEQAFP